MGVSLGELFYSEGWMGSGGVIFSSKGDFYVEMWLRINSEVHFCVEMAFDKKQRCFSLWKWGSDKNQRHFSSRK